ncbi:hypothetical protein [Burkholderia sp. Ac-20365]|uniref:hypothetical protein n=1 Tax=Burkholderia sp. Ac-20365 TaxID=2703897 RepID=UPI00197BBAFB|nr:hypothetical protein [Burkholderia sp. Ac-20365]MBN3759432.1 hypothetical protein [Burkholderia sp. Ac-20365]
MNIPHSTTRQFEAFVCDERDVPFFDDEGKPLPPGCDRDLVDLTLEIAHNCFGPRPPEGGSDYIVTVDLLNITKTDIDINAMIEEAWIRDVNLTKMDNGLIRFDLNPNIGLDIVVACHEVTVESIRPYDRDALVVPS